MQLSYNSKQMSLFYSCHLQTGFAQMYLLESLQKNSGVSPFKPYPQHGNNPSQGQPKPCLGYHQRRWPVKTASHPEPEGFIRK